MVAYDGSRGADDAENWGFGEVMAYEPRSYGCKLQHRTTAQVYVTPTEGIQSLDRGFGCYLASKGYCYCDRRSIRENSGNLGGRTAHKSRSYECKLNNRSMALPLVCPKEGTRGLGEVFHY